MDADKQVIVSTERDAERVKLRDALEELHRLQTIFGSVSNGITISDVSLPDQPLIYVNPAFERMTGYAAAEAYGRNCRYLQGEDRGQPELALVRAAIREGREVRVVLRNYRKDGGLFWNELYLSPIFDLAGQLTHFVGVQNDVTLRVESAKKIEYLAHHDALTGVFNRGQLMARLKQTLERARHTGRFAALLFLDMDRFKQVNDVLGHDAGDRLLVVVAERLKSFVREQDTLARMGGDEFVMVLENIAGEAQAIELMQQLSSSLCEPTQVLGEDYRPSASVGLALYPRDGETADALLRAADLKMYVAKHSSRSEQQYQEESSPCMLKPR